MIQAFEFTHEISWLLLKDLLVDQGVSGISGARDSESLSFYYFY